MNYELLREVLTELKDSTHPLNSESYENSEEARVVFRYLLDEGLAIGAVSVYKDRPLSKCPITLNYLTSQGLQLEDKLGDLSIFSMVCDKVKKLACSVPADILLELCRVAIREVLM